MKKYIFLLTFTIILISIFALAGKHFESLTVEADVTVVDPRRVDEDMMCTGKVEFEKSKNVFLTSPGIVKEVLFKEGDCVKSGDVLLELFKVEEKSIQQTSGTNKNTSDTSNLQEFEALYRKYIEGNQGGERDQAKQNFAEVKPTKEVIKVVSPVSGVLTSIVSKEGQCVVCSNAVATISDRTSLQIRTKISETQISNVAVGQRVIVTGVGFKDTSYEGVIKSIAGQASGSQDAMSSDVCVDVIVSINASDENIKPGFTAKCKIIFNKDLNIIIVPYKSVKADDNGREYVFKCENGKTIKSYVTTGRELDDGFEIKSGIKEGDYIVTDPTHVGEGTCIKVKNIN